MSGSRTEALAAVLLTAALSLSPCVKAAAIPRDVPQALLDTLDSVMSGERAFVDAFEAQVWLLDMQHRLTAAIPDPTQRLALLGQVHQQAWEARLSPQLVLAIIQVESAFRPNAVSSAGAQGLMQIMPFWKREIGRPEDDLFDPATNLRYGCTILAFYLDLEHGDMTRALARYNGSLGQTIYPERVMRAWSQRWWISQE
ncbi:lytic transglycosylase domain-containing protein [Halomonas shantousis]